VKLEFLPDGSLDCPLIRLCQYTPVEAGKLYAVVVALASGMADRVDVHALDGVQSIGNCQLQLTALSWDQAVVQEPRRAEFVRGLTRPVWENVAGLIEPFMRGASGCQWLARQPGHASLLLSVDGHW